MESASSDMLHVLLDSYLVQYARVQLFLAQTLVPFLFASLIACIYTIHKHKQLRICCCILVRLNPTYLQDIEVK